MATQLATTDASPPPQALSQAISQGAERFALLQRQARMFACSPLVPDHLRKGPPEVAMANCYIALTLAEAMGEVPLIVMQNIHFVHGVAGFKSEYKIARANRSGIFTGRIDWRIDKTDPKNMKATAFAILKDTGEEVAFTCDLEMARAEGWTSNKKYQTMPEVMLRYRSASFLIRFYAGDVMLGYQTIEEMEDVVYAEEPANPLTATMLIDQSRGAGDPPHDPTTGEIGPEETEEEASREGRTDAQHGDAHDGANPSADLADELIDRVQRAPIIGDVLNVEKEFTGGERMKMEPVDQDRVETAIEAAKTRLKGNGK